MSKLLLTDMQVEKLKAKKHIRSVSNKAITYTDGFKIKLVKETEDYKKLSRDVFKECGIGHETVGILRVSTEGKRWRNKLHDCLFLFVLSSEVMNFPVKQKN